MEFPTLINMNRPFYFKGCWVVVFIFIQFLTENSVSIGDRNQTPQNLHCLPMSHKEDARLIWVKVLLDGLNFNLYLQSKVFLFVCLFVCVDALHPIQYLFSHVGTFSCLTGLNQC